LSDGVDSDADANANANSSADVDSVDLVISHQVSDKYDLFDASHIRRKDKSDHVPVVDVQGNLVHEEGESIMRKKTNYNERNDRSLY